MIELQSLYNYFSNNDKSANGIYTIIPKSNKNKEVLLKEMSDFFGLTIKDLQTPKMHSKKGYINEYLFIYIGIFSILSLLTLLSILSIPMKQIKNIGVWKLVGFKSKEILKQLFLFPYLTSLIVSLIFDSFVILYFDYLPTHFLWSLIAIQLIIFGLLSLSVLFAYSIIKEITVTSLIKNSQRFRLGIGTTFILKILMIILTTVLLIGSLANIHEILKATEIYNKVANEGKFLTVDKIGVSTEEATKNFRLNNGVNEDKTSIFFLDLEKNINAYFFYGTIIDPIKNFPLYQPRKMFKPSDKYQTIKVNENYLKSISLKIPKEHNENVFLVPLSFKANKAKIEELCKMMAYNRMGEQARKNATLEKTKVTIDYYNKSINTNVFLNDDIVTFTNPIYELIASNHLDYISKMQLLTTEVNSPIRIENSKKIETILQNSFLLKQ
ncbi:hypothetical protein [Melissococcus plutonius]|uniref:hypothetical protein n=1 Tax=Melissococcus plutonius TaxID=33970 RepID=UPI00065E0184|nr:hypothetical protein [Melissococcus plutonius]